MRDSVQVAAVAEPERVHPIAKEIGKKIRFLRTRRFGGKITQGEVARRAGLSISFLSMIERGERACSVDALAGIARALGVPLAELFAFGPVMAVPEETMRPLLDFCRRRNLTGRDVEKLLSVARAMFGER